jgi:hypothetical protein
MIWSPGFVLLQLVTIVGLSLPCDARDATPVTRVNPVRPLQTELIAPLDLTHVHGGSPVLVRVDLDWIGPNCSLRAGSVVRGHVVAIVKRSKSVKDSEVQLTFDGADCEVHHETPFRFTLVALVGPAGGSSSTGQSGVSEAPPLADAVGNPIGGAGGLRSVQTASAINSGFNLPARNLPTQIMPGQVVGIRKIKLSVAAGVDGATVVTALGHNLRLEQGTSLILTRSEQSGKDTNFSSDHAAPSSKQTTGFAMSGTGGGVVLSKGVSDSVVAAPVAATTTPTPIPETPDETEICTNACNVLDGTKAESEVRDSAATASLPLRKLGYSPRENREIRSFDDQTTLTYLDAKNLLCTFDPHQLRERTGLGEEAVRNIRAVLVDPETHSVKRIMEWRVRGDEQYLWRLSEGRVLVHMGHELNLFDAQLNHLRSIHVEGRVAWVVSSPTSDHIAVGTIRERHSELVHSDLETILSDEPEEDIEVRVLDKSFAVVVTALRSSKMSVPVLSDSGELRVHGDGHTHWKITEYRWDQTEHTIASTRSACRPVLSTPEHDLIFAVGCTATGGRWYRMLRSDGHPLLKAESPSDEIQQSAQGAVDGTFAIRVVKTVRPMNYGQPFRKADLTQEKIAIYRSTDGASLTAVTTADFALSEMAFALSPSGEQMALIGGNSLFFYAVNLRQN